MRPGDAFDPNCPTRQVLDRIADKWTVLVVCALDHESRRFGELRRAVGGISQKVLTSVLRSLERDGIVSRHVFANGPLRVDYRLTPLGRSLLVLVVGLREWAEHRMALVSAARSRYDRVPTGEPKRPARGPVASVVPAHRSSRRRASGI